MGNTSGSSLEQQVQARIENLAYLPTTVAVAMKFVELGRNPEAEPGEYAQVVSSDASLSTKLLALANSSWFGVRNKVTKPQVAVNLLGLGTVRTLALSYCLTGLHHELRIAPEDARSMWSAALCKAVAAKHFAALTDEKSAEEAFAAGMFQDFAIPIMFACARQEMSSLLDDPTTDSATRLQRERALFRLDHAEVGRAIAQKLELPEIYVDAVAFHHNRASLREFVGREAVADAIYVSSLFPHRLNLWCPQDAEELKAFYSAHAVSAKTDIAAYMQGVQDEFRRLFSYFEQGDKNTIETQLLDLMEAAARESADNTQRLVGTVHQLINEVASAGREAARAVQDPK